MIMKHLLCILLFMASSIVCEYDSNKTVYICTGTKAYAYHVNKNCSGLSNCKGTIKAVTLSEAEAQHRKPCKKCCK